MSKSKKGNIYHRIAVWFCGRYGFEKDDIKYIALFLDMLTFQIFEIIVLLTIGFYLNIIIETILVMIFFVLARVRYRGLHAQSKVVCLILTTLLIIGVSYVSSTINPFTAPIMGYITGVCMRDRRKIEKGSLRA